MSDAKVSSLHVEDLERVMRAADPAALLVSPRLLRRVIKQDQELPGIGLQVPHRKSYVIGREALLGIVDGDELGAAARDLPPTVILLARPTPERLASLGAAGTLTRYWRMLFHAHVHIAIEQRFAERGLSADDIQARIEHIGRVEFDEIHTVLRQENYLLAPQDPRAVYVEFAAFYLELRYFSDALVRHYFPALHDWEAIDRLLAEDVEASRLFARTRLEGAPDPVARRGGTEEAGLAADVPREATAPQPQRSESVFRKLIRRAKRADKRGNVVRAAILRTQAAHVGATEQAGEARAAARLELDRLTQRLQAALHLSDDEAQHWRRALPVLLEHAAEGHWSVEARFLYDLQKVCIDFERDIFAVDLVEWAISLGKRPVKRHLPSQRYVRVTRHLRSAARRLAAVRIPDPARRELSSLLQHAVHRSELRLRVHFRPLIGAALEEVGLRPENLPEQVARNKLIEELLDRITERGFLTMGDLRDALSRNRLKVPDLASVREFLLGDRLLRLNRRLAVALDGVYHRGEVYLRWLQRLSAAAFGTRVGRFLTRYVALPFGGAFVVLKGAEEVVHLCQKAVHKWSLGQEQVEAFSAAAAGTIGLLGSAFGQGPVLTASALIPKSFNRMHLVHFARPPSVAVLGVFLLGLLYVPAFRRQVGWLLKMLFFSVRGLVYDLPRFVLNLPAVREFLQSPPLALFRRHVLKPLVFTAAVAPLFPLCGATARTALLGSAAVFLIALLLLNSRVGRRVEEAVIDWLVRRWQQVRYDIVPGLFRFILYLFKRLVEDMERLIYTVDEWLRFRTGESRFSLVAKPVLGIGWFAVTYVFRIYLNLLIEPTFNPIKHFPVVTVAAKIMVPFYLTIEHLVAAPLVPLLGKVAGNTVAAATVVLLPGVFGFLVWELKENWRLYRANQAKVLEPVVIGHHGETMVRLFRPGIHSGTVPKLYARLRRAERSTLQAGAGPAARKQLEALHHVEELIRHFVEREFLYLLHESRNWAGAGIADGAIHLCTNGVRIELRVPERAGEGVWVAFEQQGGWLIAEVWRPGWLPQLSREQLRVFRTALAGLYKLAGVDLVRDQIEASLGGKVASFDVREEGLVVWPGRGQEAVYELRDEGRLRPWIVAGPGGLPELDAGQLLFKRRLIPWLQWVEVWERDQAGKERAEEVLEDVRLLPDGV